MSGAPQLADASDELPVFFPAGQEDTLFGILTEPTVTPLGIGVILLAGGGAIGSVHRNRISVRLCRVLASHGYHTLRFDWHGVGESTGAVDRFRLGEPFVEDLLGAVELMKGRGIRRLVLFGTCFGARTAVAAAPAIDELESLVLISLPVLDYGDEHRTEVRAAAALSTWQYVRRLRPVVLWGLADRRRRRTYVNWLRSKLRASLRSAQVRSHTRQENQLDLNRGVEDALDALTTRRIPVLAIYGAADQYYGDLMNAKSRQAILENELIDVQVLDGEIHRFDRIEAQEQVLSVVNGWLSNRAKAQRSG